MLVAAADGPGFALPEDSRDDSRELASVSPEKELRAAKAGAGAGAGTASVSGAT